MLKLLERRLDADRVAHVVMTERADGDFSVLQDAEAVAAVRASALAEASLTGTWTWLRQVHGCTVVVAAVPGDGAGHEADAAVTNVSQAVLVAQVADCVPVAFVATEGVVGVAHAGWRGLVDGVLGATVAELRAAGAGELTAVVGPSIGVECYEFGESDLTRLVHRFGDRIVGVTSDGSPALDMAAGVGAELDRLGVAEVVWANPCTSCHANRFWSFRARRESERQAMFVVIDEDTAASSTDG